MATSIGPEETSPAFVKVESELVLSCAVCGWTPGCTGTSGPLFWAVIEHWLAAHWEAVHR